MSITGERGANKATKPVALLDAPIVPEADLFNSASMINDTARSGKRAGAMVYVTLASDGSIGTAVAQGSNPTDGWSVQAGLGAIPQIASRKKMEVRYDAVAETIATGAANLIGIIKLLTPAAGSLNDFFNQNSEKLNVYNDDATLFFKMNVTGTWNAASSNPNTMQVSFANSYGNIISSLKTSSMDADVLQFVTFLSIDKDGAIATGGSEITIKVLDSDFAIDSIFIVVEQFTTETVITPV